MDVPANQIQIYTTQAGQTQIEVQFDGDTVWLSQDQLSVLFERDQSVISRHISNVFKEGELDKKSNMQKMHIANSDKPVSLFCLDVIISVGYRVKSNRGTQFRQWATQRLKDYLVEGFAINEKRLEQKNKELQVLHDGIRILSRAIEEKANKDENFIWLNQFSVGLQLLDDYDHACLDHQGRHFKKAIYPSKWEYEELVLMMCHEFNSAIFGKAKDGGFDSSINQIKQGFGEQDVYPSIEEKAAMLLYFVVKNHSFVDGNKRIAAACFILFLERNVLLYNSKNETVISNEALASLTLFVAASKAEEMQTVKYLLISVLNRGLDR
jgi:prophage maintenance system killer protein